MDNRITWKQEESFIPILQKLLVNSGNANMLLDSEGMMRVEGIVEKIVLTANPAYIQLSNGIKIVIRTIVAINGVFLSDYSEC
jgi:hypothetical protein